MSVFPLDTAPFVANINLFESFAGYFSPMSATLSALLAAILKIGWVALLFNEVRGAILAVPVLYGMYQAGGSWMAIWVGFCSLVGIAISVIVPLIAAKKIQKFADEKVFKVAKEPALVRAD